MKTPNRKQEKRFRNGYCSARISADEWITEQIATIREVCEIDGVTLPKFIIHK